MLNTLPVPANEPQRTVATKSYKILDSGAGPEFDRLTQLASVICKVPLSLIMLIDEERAGLKSKQGLDAELIERLNSYCTYTISGGILFEVEDVTTDDRFGSTTNASGASAIQFYAGYPIVDTLGNSLGTFCVLDRKPNKLTEEQVFLLRVLAQEAASHIVAKEVRKRLELYEALYREVRVLVVEGDRPNQEKSLQILSNFGFVADVAESGNAAIEKVKNNRYDIVLMDMQMPEGNVYETISHIRKELHISIPIVAMVAGSVEDASTAIYEAGINDFVQKSYSAKELYSVINQLTSMGKVAQKLDGELNIEESVIDLTYLKNFSDGSSEFEKEMIEMYISKTPEEMDIIENAIQEGDYDLIMKRAHKVSSSFALMGIKEQGLLKQIEEYAGSHVDIAIIRASFNKLKAIFQQSIVLLNKELEN